MTTASELTRPLRRKISVLATLAVLLALLSVPATADAATVGIEDGVLVYVAAKGELNEVVVEVQNGGYHITDEGNPISTTPGPDNQCLAGAGQVVCNASGVEALRIEAGDESDTVGIDDSVELPATVLGGDGPDAISGTAKDDVLDGGPGADTIAGEGGKDRITCGDGSDTDIHGGEGDDTIDCGAGDDKTIFGEGGADTVDAGAGADILDGGEGGDTLVPGPGADVVTGGPGTDSVSYADRTVPVTVELNNNPDDGENGENDDIQNDIESITGGAGDDRLAGDDNPNTLDGGGGADTLLGRGGNDTLVGGPGDDPQLDGGIGADSFSGGDGRDTVSYAGRAGGITVTIDATADDGEPGEGDFVSTDIEEVAGGAGNDHLIGNDGRNFLTGLGGADVIEARGGDDVINGGPGADTLSGGDGSDIADFFSEEAPITLTGDGIANDGAEGEGDNLGADIEGVIGGPFGDRFLGGPGNDFIYGYDGDDLVFGGPGTDMLVAGNGDDHIQSVDGVADFISCGDGAGDTALVDPLDSVATDCENKLVVPVLASVAGKATSTPGVALVSVTCPAIAIDGCSGTLALRANAPVAPKPKPKPKARGKKKKARKKRRATKRTRVVQLGSASFSLAPGQTAVVSVKLTPAGQKLLTTMRKLATTATIATTDVSGSKSTDESTFVLTAPPKPKPKPRKKRTKRAA